MNVLQYFEPIRLFAFDMDGVLTDGTVMVMPEGDWVRRMHIRDGFALQLAVKKGYEVAMISGSWSQPVADRMGKLGVRHVYEKVGDKASCLGELLKKLGLTTQQVLFMGDDVPDLPALAMAGLPACPADAADDVRSVCRYISPFRGGEGCVRDVIEKTLRLNGHWDASTGLRSI
jgi:3-deoxy-D-manno-octulosonate 8-phosphate phosphatase (KDO 8-P phosphatase)